MGVTLSTGPKSPNKKPDSSRDQGRLYRLIADLLFDIAHVLTHRLADVSKLVLGHGSVFVSQFLHLAAQIFDFGAPLRSGIVRGGIKVVDRVFRHRGSLPRNA